MGIQKICNVCKEPKELNDFWVRSDNNQLRNTCKNCQKEQAVENNKLKQIGGVKK